MIEVVFSSSQYNVMRGTLYVFLGIYSASLLYTLSKLVRLIWVSSLAQKLRLKFFYISVCFVLMCKFQSVRISWLLFLWVDYSPLLFSLLDVIPSSIVTLLGSTFSLFWIQIYLTTNILLHSSTQKVVLNSCIVIFVVFNFLSIFSGVWLCVDYYTNQYLILISPLWKSIVIQDSVFSFLTSMSVLISGRFLTVHAKATICSKQGEILLVKLQQIVGASFTVYFFKCCLMITLYWLHGIIFQNTFFVCLFLFIYFGFAEIFPLGLIFYISSNQSIKPNSDDQEDLPDVMKEFNPRSLGVLDSDSHHSNTLRVHLLPPQIKMKKVAKNQKAAQRRAWTSKQDQAISWLVKQYGTKQWTVIAEQLSCIFAIQGRNGKQCRQRWHNHLDPGVSKENWSLEEDLVLFQNHSKLGNKWAEISNFLPGRTDNSIKNHFYSTLRKQFRKRNGSDPTREQIRKHDQELTRAILKALNKRDKQRRTGSFSQAKEDFFGKFQEDLMQPPDLPDLLPLLETEFYVQGRQIMLPPKLWYPLYEEEAAAEFLWTDDPQLSNEVFMMPFQDF